MRSEERRQSILEHLQQSTLPVSAGYFAKHFSVSRQVVVGDIALLRAAGEEISSTPRGYVILKDAKGLTRQIVCQHGVPGMEAELKAIVDHGCAVLNVIVDHTVYGQLTGSLQLSSRYDVDQFLLRFGASSSKMLSNLTGGIHLHTLACPDEAAYQRTLVSLRELGVLLEE